MQIINEHKKSSPYQSWIVSTLLYIIKKTVISNCLTLTWQRPTLPHGLPCSTIGAIDLNCPVRNGKECYLYAIITRLLLKGIVPSKLHIVFNVYNLDFIGQALDLLVSVS